MNASSNVLDLPETLSSFPDGPQTRPSIDAAASTSEDSCRDGKPLATLSIDLDDQWAYRRAAGFSDWERSPSCFDVAVPRLVDTLGALDLPLTVFLVGRDFDRAEAANGLRALSEIPDVEYGNHSWNHLPWLHTMSQGEIGDEIGRTHEAIANRFGREPVGFRGPGFSCPESVLGELLVRGYRYDASMFPTSMAPIARMIFLMRSQLKGAEREKAKKLYGGFASMLQPNRPHQRKHHTQSIWELPVTTMPCLRTPIHFSYLLFLASKSPSLAKFYFSLALRACRFFSAVPSLLLHPPDFLGADDETQLDHLPGMNWPTEKKLAMVRWALAKLDESFQVWTLDRYVRFQIASAAPDRWGAASRDADRPRETGAPSI